MTFDEQVGARTLWQEARGEPLVGQQAVAWVLKNRVIDGRWGKNLSSVCLWRAQFSGWYMPHDPNFAAACGLSDVDPTLLVLGQVLAAVMSADQSADPTTGACWYYAKTIAPPAWVKGATFCGHFGSQLFYRGVQ